MFIVIGSRELRGFVVQISMYRPPGYQVMDITASPSEKPSVHYTGFPDNVVT